MKRITTLACVTILAAAMLAASLAFGRQQVRQDHGSAASGSHGTSLYDPARDPERDVGDAIIQANWSGKRILLEVGGDWCGWCHKLEEFLNGDPELVALRDKNFVVVKVNYSQENPNDAFLSKYPKILGFPHIFILGSDGKFLYSEDTSKLEQGNGYNRKRVAEFLKKWGPE